MIPDDWMPPVRMRRIIFHWTAGAHKPNDSDRRAYHFLIDGAGNITRGIPSIAANSGSLQPGYAAHTRNLNTDSIGIGLCCMGGAREHPFHAGTWPMKREQIDAMIKLAQHLGKRYNIPVDRKTMLSHAEVQSTLDVRQNGKWDFTRFPFMPEMSGAHVVGDWLRKQIGQTVPLSEPILPPVRPQELPPVPAGATGVVKHVMATTHRAPKGERIGSLPEGTVVEILGQENDWLHVRSPAGFLGWTDTAGIKIVDGPPTQMPTQPNPVRAKLDQMRDLIDQLEKIL